MVDILKWYDSKYYRRSGDTMTVSCQEGYTSDVFELMKNTTTYISRAYQLGSLTEQLEKTAEDHKILERSL